MPHARCSDILFHGVQGASRACAPHFTSLSCFYSYPFLGGAAAGKVTAAPDCLWQPLKGVSMLCLVNGLAYYDMVDDDVKIRLGDNSVTVGIGCRCERAALK